MCQANGVSFQSAPLTDVRGDQGPTFMSMAPLKFQSAPLTDVRGDIHSLIMYHMRIAEFQSAPLTDVRGDSVAVSIRNA